VVFALQTGAGARLGREGRGIVIHRRRINWQRRIDDRRIGRGIMLVGPAGGPGIVVGANAVRTVRAGLGGGVAVGLDVGADAGDVHPGGGAVVTALDLEAGLIVGVVAPGEVDAALSLA